MVKSGRKKKPNAVKRQRGTDEPRRMDAGEVVQFDVVKSVDDLPNAPGWFLALEEEWSGRKWAIAETFFDAIRGQLFAVKVLSRVHIDPLATLAALQAIVAEDLRTGTISASMITQYRALCEQFGITPSSQRSVTPVDAGRKVNKFAGHGRP